MATNNLEVDRNHADLKAVENQKNNLISQNNTTYDTAINNSNAAYDNLIGGANSLKQDLIDNQNKETDFAIEKIEQQKEQLGKDYQKEQSASYVDYKKQSNKYGANAEQMASQGMGGTGYSESSQVSMYNTYQNRVATARQTYQLALQNYNNAITEAKLQNSSALAQIALDTWEKVSSLTIQKIANEQTLRTEKAKQNLTILDMYNTNWNNVYNRLLEEKKLQESQRQYEKSFTLQQAQLAEEQRQFNILHGSSGVSSGGSSGGSSNIRKSVKDNASVLRPYNQTKNSDVDKVVDAINSNQAKQEKVTTIANELRKNNLDAKAILKKYGLTMGKPRFLTANEFLKAKQSGESEKYSDLRAYGTYSEYVKQYVVWRMNNK